MKERTYPQRGLHGQVVHRVGLLILRGELRPGDPLPNEDDLAVELGVSRTVLREAIKVLAAKGLVESRPKTGMRVRPRRSWNLTDPDVLSWQLEASPDAHFFANLSEVRRLIEPAAARLAAERATDEEIASLERWYRKMELAVDDRDAYIASDLRFHEEILDACHNELLAHMGSMLRAVFRASRALTTRVPGSSARAMPLHWAIVEAIRDHDGPRAEAAMLELIATTAADVDRALKAGLPA